jgi:hypothetical protein
MIGAVRATAKRWIAAECGDGETMSGDVRATTKQSSATGRWPAARRLNDDRRRTGDG